MKSLFSLLLMYLVALPLSLRASDQDSIYKAYVSGDMGLWRRIIDKMHDTKDKPSTQELDLLNFEYGYIGWCLGAGKNALAKAYMKRMEERMNRLAQQQIEPALLYAYMSAHWGFQVGLNKLKAPFLGQKSIAAARKSVELDPDNPLGHIQLGNIDFFRPPLFGGSKQEALRHYLAAERLLLSTLKAEGRAKDWNLLSLQIQIATTFESIDDIKRADEYYKKILTSAPDFKWVRDELYPKFKQKHNLK